MSNDPIHTIASAPEKSKLALEWLQQTFDVLPNLPAVIANSPKLINSLVAEFQQVHSPGFTEAENQIVLLTDAVTSSCNYAVAFHTALARICQAPISDRRKPQAIPSASQLGELLHYWR
jgi:hypothetical protein